MEFLKLFKAKHCTTKLVSSTKDGVLAEITDLLVEGGALEEPLRADTVRALLEREKLGSTGVGSHVAVPHVKVRGLDRAVCSLAIHPEGLAWAAVDSLPVHVIFTVLRPEKGGDAHDPERHLEMMRWIARLSRDQDFRRFAMRVKTKTELLDLLKEKSAV
ncbi:MAG: PTS sugar transporter subunit IIA [Planctomycetota bacterium]|nr:PTS sugar transporter subunit IIA [Planctomycetota bacterium]